MPGSQLPALGESIPSRLGGEDTNPIPPWVHAAGLCTTAGMENRPQLIPQRWPSLPSPLSLRTGFLQIPARANATHRHPGKQKPKRDSTADKRTPSGPKGASCSAQRFAQRRRG